MKVNWQATVSEKWMTQTLRRSIRLRMMGSWIWLGLEVLSTVVMLVFAGVLVEMGEFVTAAAVIALNGICVVASIWARRLPVRGASGNLIELVDLTILSARRSARFACAQYLMTAAGVAYVLFVYFADLASIYDDVGDMVPVLVVTAVYAAGVVFYHRNALGRLRRFTDLRREIGPSGSPD